MTHIIVTCITKHIVIEIHRISLLTKETLVALKLDHLSIQYHQQLEIKIGQLQLLNRQQQSIASITTPSTLTLSGILQSNIDIEFQLGKTVLYCDEIMKLVSSSSSSTTNSVSREVLNSMRVTVECMQLVWAQLESSINSISITVRRHHTPFVQVTAGQWTCSASNTQVVLVPSIDITMAKSQHTFAPYTKFISVTCILNSPVVNIHASHLITSNNLATESKEFEKTWTDLPLCTFAIVFNSPKVQLHVPETVGVIAAESFIVRVSGEYVTRGRDDIPSASSGSESHLDVLFAQEEYQWMRNITGYQQLTTKWTQLMDKVSRTTSPSSNQKWSYRVSAKFSMYKLKIGHVESGSETQFLQMKHAVLVFKIRFWVGVKEGVKYETVVSLDQGVQSEVSIEKPVVSLWNDSDTVCSSVVWLSMIPARMKEVRPTSNSKARPVWVESLLHGLKFSLEVTEGSIVVTSLDRAQISMDRVPEGYIDNTPKETVWTRLVLDTQKFNMVCEGGKDWNVRCHVDTLYLQQASGTGHLAEEEKKKVIVWISQLNLVAKVCAVQEALRQVTVACKVKKYGICYSVQHHYVCLLFVRSLLSMKQQLSGKKKKESSKVQVLVDLDVQVARGDVHLFLPKDNQLYLRMDGLVIERKAVLVIKFRNMMVLGQSAVHPQFWEQLLEIDQAQISIKHQRQIDLKSRKIFASVPYSYTLSTVLDSVIGVIKAIKVLHTRLLTEDAFTYFGPTCNNDPVLIPCIQIKTHVLKVLFDDDPFEAKLRCIFRTGLVEQQKRLAYEEALQVKIQEMAVAHDTCTTEEESSTLVEEQDDLTEVDAQICEAKKKLLVHFSSIWIKNIKDQKSQEETFYKELHVKDDYRNSVTFEALDETLDEVQRPESVSFIIEIQPRPLYPALAHFSSQFTKISFKPADFSLQETRQFIHTIGDGVPLDNNFSVIVPFHLSIKAGQTWVKVRDYPLPLLYVPPLQTAEDDGSISTRRSRNQSRVAWSLEGNYALGDELGGSCGSRIIDIPIIPGLGSFLGYTLSAVRTTSPVKFYSVVDYRILTPSMTTICWSVSYSPAIQDIGRVLESLSAEQVDPSSRLGFWDKVRFSIHTQTKLSFVGGGDLALVVKGTRDPYELLNRGAGLTKIWSQEVVWLLGYKNPQHEFMQIVSQQYAFGVPDLVRGGFVPSLPDSFERKSSMVNEEDTNRFLKVVLKLTDGIRMGIGLGFERLGCNRCNKCVGVHRLNRCRSQVFSPHYNVLFQSTKQVETFLDEDNYDAFHGFRSDFVHLSLSIIKLHKAPPDATSQNAMYISPCFIEHFSHWYRLLGSPISIPVRQGNLFPRDAEKSKSFGEHLNTVKYKFVINPLTIGLFCTDEESYMHVKGGGSAGLKALVSQFSVDLHQRRELNTVDPALKAEMSFHELEIELHAIDLRVIKASLSATASDDDEEEEEADEFQWVDPRDFVILDSVSFAHQNHIRYKKIRVHPFAFSPLFYYVRQNDEGSTASRDYLRQTHDCIMGKGTDILDSHEFQKAHLLKRGSDLDITIEEYDKQLDIVLNAMHTMHPYEKEVSDQHAILVEKINYLRTNRYMLHTYIAKMILETELNASGRDSPQTTTSSIGRRNDLCRWETLMGPFQDRFFIHNPQIIWNNSVRDAIYYWQEIKDHRSVQVYNLSSRCFKFLQDLVHTAEKQQQWKPDVPVATTTATKQLVTEQEPEKLTQKLIDKLLAERLNNFVAYNEKEENKSKSQQPQQPHENIHVFESSTENVDDPDYQYKNIPDSYEMKSKYLIDMVNPQVNFQSDKGLDHLIVFTNERIHVKAFSIIDNSSSSGAADKDVRIVKDRIIVALDNAQLLVAKRMEFLAVDLLTQSAYGQCRNSHWAAWVQPEQLWYYKDVKYFDNFQRVASQLCGTIQLDRYNHLRIKINKYNTSRKSPFEDRTNTMQLHFPQFKLMLNSQQGHVLYYTLINLLLGNSGSPRKKERLNRFRDVMLAAERSDLAETVKQVGVLQTRSRVLLELHQRFMQALPRLDSLGVREFNSNKKKMRQNLEKLYLVVEAIRCIQTFRRDIHLEETDNAMRFSFTSDEIVWEAVLNNESSLCKWILTNTKFVFFNKQNGSSKSTIEVERMQLKNMTDEPVFTDVLDAYVEPGQVFDSRQKMVRGVLESLPPVGGIPVIQQLEINLVPLNLQISMAFGTAMKDYFFPRIVVAEETVETDETDSEEIEEEYEDDEDAVSLVDGLDVTSGNSSKLDNQSLSTSSVDKTFNSRLSKREGSFASFDLITKKVKETVRRKKSMKSDELTVMKNRSSTNRTFIYIRIPATKHCLSLRGPTQNTFYNLYNFPFKQPNLEYRNMTWSLAEMMEEIQRQFLRAALRHSPALLKNKLMSNSKQPTPSISTSQSIKSGASIKSDTTTQKKIRPSVTSQSSYNTEEEDFDVKSLHSNDPEDELERLVEQQVINKRISLNVDQELLNFYMNKYKQEEEVDENIYKGRMLFGESYKGVYHPAL
ncbi:hypothetical protein HPULCUR_011209 [Helicostylum pulchrum]|uniref:Uncharacterized protein n=1 Tax=Helicostylum pulchrum TaxID=562976 RepID=A0ABP9YFI1_9FUNG